jgi:hypothetical protein
MVDQTQGTEIVRVKWRRNDSDPLGIGNRGAEIDGDYRIVAPDGFDGNGKRGVIVEFRYDPKKTNSGANERLLQIRPDTQLNNRGAWFYHAQLEEKPYSTSPMIQNGTPISPRDRDKLYLFPNPFSSGQPDWFSSNESTFVVELTPRWSQHNGFPDIISTVNFSARLEYNNHPARILYNGPNQSSGLSIEGQENETGIYEKQKVALSMSSSKHRLAINGSTKLRSGGPAMLGSEGLKIQPGALNSRIHSITYYPRLFTEEELSIVTKI